MSSSILIMYESKSNEWTAPMCLAFNHDHHRENICCICAVKICIHWNATHKFTPLYPVSPSHAYGAGTARVAHCTCHVAETCVVWSVVSISLSFAKRRSPKPANRMHFSPRHPQRDESRGGLNLHKQLPEHFRFSVEKFLFKLFSVTSVPYHLVGTVRPDFTALITSNPDLNESKQCPETGKIKRLCI